MSTLKTHNLQSPDAGSVNIAMTPNAGMIVAGLSTYSNQINVGSNIKLGTAGIITATSFVGSGANLTSLPAQATIANNADNRIITGGSGVNLNGEADLTFDGNDLTVNKTSGDSDVIIKTTTSGNPVLKLNAAGAGGHDISHDRSSNSLIFNRTGSAERMRIDSIGRLLVGTTAGWGSNVKLHLASSGNTYAVITAGTSSNSVLAFSDDGTERGSIDYDHNGDLMLFKTAASERLRITSGGNVNIGGDYTQTSYKLSVNGSAMFKHTEADIWLTSTGGSATTWRILGSTGGSTHQFRIYDQTNTADRLNIDSNGNVIIGDTSTTNASANADNLVISGSGQIGMTIHSSNSSYSNIYFSDGTGSNHYVGYCQYNHGSNHLNLGAGGAQRAILYDKDGASGTSKAVLQIGGSTGSNHYNVYQGGASITFGGGNDIENYFIGTRMEDYAGNYTKLDLRWHTGIRIGAQSVYGGVRFFNDEDLDSLKFSIMGGGDHVESHTNFRPGANNTYNCGTSGRRWASIWYYNANTTSDRNEKNTITESDLGLDFICKLKPVSYKWNQREGENADTKTHYGLISQDVEEAVIESGKTLDNFGAIVKPEGDDPMGLSYNEFISPLVKAIQEQQEQIKILQEKIASLEGS